MLQIENLTVAAGEKRLLKNVSLSLQEGERLGIVGASGSGKTVLVRSIIQLLPPSLQITGGSILYHGEELLHKNEKELRQIRGKEIGMVFQDPLTFLNPTSRIGVQIMEGYQHHFPLASKEEARSEVLALLHKVGIAEPHLRFMHYPHQLSGGMRQRVLLAIALISKPKLLIADEPTTALDGIIQKQIIELLKSVHPTTIFISHDLRLVASFCSRVVVLKEGEIIL